MPTYDDALSLFHEWTTTESLRRHGYAVEAAMAIYAEKHGEDVETFRITGLLHDVDYERHPTPDEHPSVGVAELQRLGYADAIGDAIMGHAPYTGTPRVSALAKTLFAVDELAGFVVACAFVRPTRLDGMTASSVKKKLKDKRFAAAVSRDDIRQGAEELGVDLTEHIDTVIEGLRRDAARLDLGAPPTA